MHLSLYINMYRKRPAQSLSLYLYKDDTTSFYIYLLYNKFDVLSTLAKNVTFFIEHFINTWNPMQLYDSTILQTS